MAMSIRRTWRGEEVKASLIARAKSYVRNAANFMAERARIYCPVDTGKLKRSIRVVPAGDGYYVIADAPYAKPVEFGHVSNGTWVAPNPFMRRALADTRRKFPAFGKSKVTSFDAPTGSVSAAFGA